MLKRTMRIPKNLFPLLKKNKGFEGEIFSLRVTFFQTGSTKAACIVSKKISKSAVARNKIKRQVYSILVPLLVQSNGHNTIQIFPKKNVLEKSFQEIEEDLIDLIQNNNLL